MSNSQTIINRTDVFDRNRALELLRAGVGSASAESREWQEEAIGHIVEGRGRLLVVQKT